MKFDKEKKKAIVQYILEKIENKSENLAKYVSESLNINKATVHTYINELVESGIIQRVKRDQYVLIGSKSNYVFLRENNEIQNETNIFNNCLKSHIEDLPNNIRQIWEYAFSEMINNVIDHSNADKLYIRVERNHIHTSVYILDNGVGIFEKIKNHFDLPSLDDAICELFKGKLTTDAENHSGEGIFFTSKIMDKFSIFSSDKVFTTNKFEDSFIFDSPHDEDYGTLVIMSLSNTSNKTSKEIFDKFANIHGGFTKTSLPLKNIFDSAPVSRSQARRILNSLNKFEEVVLDFENIEWMGQGFAHQIFVIYKNQNPEIKITPVNMNESVTNMYNHVVNTH